MELGLIRHGSTAWNKEGRAQGSSDIPLDEEGLKGAKLLAERLQEGDWRIIYSSDLTRARQTAEIIANKLQIKLVLDERLRETNGGLIEGTTEAERIARWGMNWRKQDLGIESSASVKARTQSFVKELAVTPVQNTLIVSHGALLNAIMSELTPKATYDQSLKNSSLTSLKLVNSIWECSLYNCTEHLM
ncbi:histidine phosphatase family protein [Niallia taxi]|uniref:histidine phosphatase family protein n=1 Tax=Niallia taxi TaxID=2499688 RepID=UPI00254F8831|nr:histidine phosphatase family protein [Niallia taxi]MDK8642541.1 histidine phosphatase family protein [Niallia taxi]